MPIDNDLKIELLGTTSNLNMYSGNTSAARQYMYCSHITQDVVCAGTTPRRVQAGIERDYGKHTFMVKMPVNAQVIKVINKYPKTMGHGGIKENPETVVVYEDIETKRVAHLTIPKFHSVHPTLGFKYTHNPKAMSMLTPEAYIKKGTVFAHSPNLRGAEQLDFSDAEYCYGLETNVAYMSIPEVIEDGFVVSEDYAKRLAFNKIESRVIEIGKTHYPLNLYGDKDNYKPFPGIGDRIRDDGLVMALRRYDELTAFNEMSIHDVTADMVDEVYDELVYGEPGALVHDVDVDRDYNLTIPTCPVGMDSECRKYEQAGERFYQEIIDVYKGLRKSRGEYISLDRDFHDLVRSSLGRVDPASRGIRGGTKIRRTYRRKPLDNWRIEIKYSKIIIPGPGYKMTDEFGGKGVKVS
jgi:hypothetical protein